jgi:hypothetical protein
MGVEIIYIWRSFKVCFVYVVLLVFMNGVLFISSEKDMQVYVCKTYSTDVA